MQGKRLTFLTALLLLALPMASAITIDSVSPSPANGNNGFYISDFDVDVTVNETANITFNLLNASGVSVHSDSADETTTHTFTIPVSGSSWDGNYTIEIEAVHYNDSAVNASDSSNQLKIDAVLPTVDGVLSNGFLNQTNATENESFRVGVNAEDDNGISIVEVGRQGQFSGTKVSMVEEDADDWYVNVTPEQDFSCSQGTTCNLVVRATDVAGNTKDLTGSIDIVAPPTSQNQTQDNLTINIIEPSEGSDQYNSIVHVSLEVDASGLTLPDGAFCLYFLKNNTDGSLIPSGSGSINTDDFNGSQGSMTYEFDIEGLTDWEYDLEVSCRNEGGSITQAQIVNFDVFDTINPSLVVDVEAGTTSANISVNGSETFRITDFAYRDLEDNMFNVTHTDDFDTHFEFELENLKEATVYIMKIGFEDRAGNEGETTENFETESLETEENETTNETQEQNIYDVLNQNRTIEEDGVNQTFSGENFSYGRDWLRMGEDTDILITNFDMNLREFVVSVREDIRNVQIKVTASTDQPYWIDNPIPSNSSVYEYIRVEATNAEDGNTPDSKVKYVKVRFEVSQSWLDDNNINGEDIVLFRYNDQEGGWNQLPTSKIGESSLFNKYEALSPGFSLFSVSARKTERESVEHAEMQINKQEDEENDTQAENESARAKKTRSGVSGTPWYAWVLGILGFAILSLIVYYVTSSFITGEDNLKDHTVIKAHMKRLEEFVDGALEKGHSKEELRKRLVESGWDERLVDFVLKRK